MASLSCLGPATHIHLELSSKFNQNYPYSNETEKEEILNRVIEAVSDLFSRFLDPKTDLSALKMQIPNPRHYPTRDKIVEFKKRLQNALQYTDENYYYKVIFTRKHADGILKQSLEQAEIKDYDNLFPEQSYLDIVIRQNKIELDIEFPKREQ